MAIEELSNIFNEIASNSSRTVKEEILKQHENNKEFREALEFLLNPYIVTGISTKKIGKKINSGKFMTWQDLLNISQLIKFLKENNTGTDYDIFVIQQFIKKQKTPELQKFVKQFATKTLKLGLTEKTVNKVYGEGTIPSFAVMLAEKYEDKEHKVTGRFYVTLKLDGNRAVAIKENGKVNFFTRKGKEIEGLTELAEHFKSLPDEWVYDGELLLVNDKNLPSGELFRATQEVVRKKGEKKNLEFYMFDALPLKEFEKGQSLLKYEQRRNFLDTYFERMTEKSHLVHILPVMYEGIDKSVIPKLLSKVIEEGYEGLMINTADGLYVNKRTDNLLKVKQFKSADLLCLGVEEGTGKNVGKLGAILVEYKGGITKVGSGFTDEQRDYFWENQDEIVGKIVEVKYFEESKDEKTGQPSMRFPIFRTVRIDKDENDIRYE